MKRRAIDRLGKRAMPAPAPTAFAWRDATGQDRIGVPDWPSVFAFRRRFAALADHLAFCSGPCCGNPRRHYGDAAPRDRRGDADARDQLNEI
jgi:hypothetical protein